MFWDIVYPQGNEKEFVAMAKTLGYGGLVFVDGKKGNYDISVVLGSEGGKGDFRIAKSSDKDRGLIERKSVDLIYGLEEGRKSDFIHHRSSGLNQVICKLMTSKKVEVGFCFRSLLHGDSKLRADIMGRMMQNVRLCRKYKTKIFFGSFAKTPFEMRSPHDLIGFGQILGMSGGESKQALQLFRGKKAKGF